MRNYTSEMRFLFSYFNDLDASAIGPDEIILYLNYLKTGLNLGRDKCRMLAQSCSFFCKHVLKKPYLLPSKLYPRKEFKLPEILSQVMMEMIRPRRSQQIILPLPAVVNKADPVMKLLE